MLYTIGEMEEYYSIGEMAKLLDIPASTLRYYDKQGLLPFVERSKSGIRMFQEKDYEWLKLIECLKKSGLTLSEIKNYIFMAIRGDETIEDRLQLFLNQKEVITQKITELQETLKVVEYKCWYYETAKKAGTVSVPKEMSLEEIPEEHKNTRLRLKSIPNED